MKARILACVLIVACIGAAAAQAKPPAYGGEKAIVKVLFTSSSQTTKTKELLPDFYKKFPNITVEWEELSTAQIETKLVSGFASNAYNYDVVSWSTPAQFAYGGFLTPMDDYIASSPRKVKEELLPIFRDYGVFNGKTYGIAWRSHIASTIVYNEAMYKAAGVSYPPKTWEELVANAPKFTKNGGFGFLFGGAPLMLRSDQGFVAWIINMGGDLLDAKNKPAFNKPEYTKGLVMFRELMKSAPAGVLSYSVGEEMAAYSQGNVANMIMGGWSLGDTNNPEKSKIPPGSSKIALLTASGNPARCSVGGWQLLIPATAKSKGAAWKFIEWATSPDIEKRVMMAGGELNGCTQVALNDPEVLKKLPYLKDVLTIAKVSAAPYVFPQIPETIQIRDILASWVSKALAGTVGDQEALDSAAKEVEDLLRNNGYY